VTLDAMNTDADLLEDKTTHTLALHKKAEKRNAFEEWLYRRKEEGTATDEFCRYSTASSTIPTTERLDRIAWWSKPDIEEASLTVQS
jgi:hypothetical protein